MHHRGNSPAKRIILKSKLEMCELSIVYGGPILTTMRWWPRPWTQLSNYFPFLTLIIHLYNNWLKLIFFFQIIIIIDLNYVSFSKSPFNNNETNFQIEQIVLLISLNIVLTLYIILELHLFDCIIIINSVVAIALYEERIYIGLSCFPILSSTFLNIIRLN